MPRVVSKHAVAAQRLRSRGELSREFLQEYVWRAEHFAEHSATLLRMLGRFDLLMPHPDPTREGFLVPSLLAPGHVTEHRTRNPSGFTQM